MTDPHARWFIYWDAEAGRAQIKCVCGVIFPGLVGWGRHSAERRPDVCPVCEGGAALETDGTCDRCGRHGSCPDCAGDDCTHLDRGSRPGKRADPAG